MVVHRVEEEKSSGLAEYQMCTQSSVGIVYFLNSSHFSNCLHIQMKRTHTGAALVAYCGEVCIWPLLLWMLVSELRS